ncbi:Structural maintenance of chromosomes protein 5 [Globomyces sp. JEL0801]|nr:Structural maintenance of chromosomes protein 5 [Globomyces sp. JEL0801]
MDSDYPIGSIVRIKLKNFLTYSLMETFPGKHMNMVIGPNGTGKSTLVCAIALGLAGKPEVLGRAKDLHDFIKHGEHQAIIELELKSSPENTKIRRYINRSSNVSKWKLNGENSTENEIKKKVQSFNIQVDNLCQFLPQDRVASFAKMSPEVLLKETERAAGSELFETHDLLISKQDKLQNMKTKLTQLQNDLKILQDKNSLLDRDVQRLNEREAIEKQIKILETKIIIVKYNSDSAAFLEAKELSREKKRLLDEVASYLTPLKEKLKECEEYVERSKQTERKAKEDYQRQTNILKENNAIMKEQDDNHQSLLQDIKRLRSQEKDRKNKLMSLEKDLESLQSRLEIQKTGLKSKGLMLDDGTISSENQQIETINDSLKEFNLKLREINNRINSLDEKSQRIEIESTKSNSMKHRLVAEIRALDDKKATKLKILREMNEATYEAVIWLRQNQGLFKGKVYEPAMLEIGLKDQRYADAIETSVPRGVFMTFICEENEDYFTFKRKVIEEKRLRVAIAVSKPSDLDKYRIDSTKYAALGFEGSILSFLEGPPAILANLCAKQGIQAHQLTLKELDDSMISEIEKRSGLMKFSIGKSFYTVRKAYGASSTRVVPNRPARILTTSVDEEYKAKLELDVKGVVDTLNGLEEEEKQLSIAKRKLKEDYEDVKNDKLLKHIEAREREVIRARASPSVLTQIEPIQRSVLNLNRERAKNTTKMKELFEVTTDLFSKRTKAILMGLKFEAAAQETRENLNNSSDGARRLQHEFEDAQRRVQERKMQAKKSHEAFKIARDSADDTVREIFDIQGHSESIPELQDMLAELEAQSALINEVDPEVLIQYNRRKQQIQTVEEDFQARSEQVEAINAQIQTLHADWRSKLLKIVETIGKAFSESFERIECVGEVGLREHESYRKWGIEIKVKFRYKYHL